MRQPTRLLSKSASPARALRQMIRRDCLAIRVIWRLGRDCRSAPHCTATSRRQEFPPGMPYRQGLGYRQLELLTGPSGRAEQEALPRWPGQPWSAHLRQCRDWRYRREIAGNGDTGAGVGQALTYILGSLLGLEVIMVTVTRSTAPVQVDASPVRVTDWRPA